MSQSKIEERKKKLQNVFIKEIFSRNFLQISSQNISENNNNLKVCFNIEFFTFLRGKTHIKSIYCTFKVFLNYF